jgi:hypothetical protein
MRLIAVLTALAILLAAPALLVAQTENHVEVGPFVDYLRFDRTNTINFVGAGGRIGFYVNPYTSLEAEMSYDFARTFVGTSTNTLNTSVTATKLRPLTGLFGPRFQFGNGPFDFFATGKLGFVNFNSVANKNLSNLGTGFNNQIAGITDGDTRFALYPGIGIEGFWGHFGLRLDVGDEIYFLDGARNNLKVNFGPHFRF